MKTLSPKNRCRVWLWVALLPLLLPCSGCLFWTTTNVEQLSHGIEVRSKTCHVAAAFLGMEGGFFPIPHYTTYSGGRIILADGEVWIDENPAGSMGKMYISPGQTYIVIQHSMTGWPPLRIFDLAARTITEVPTAAESEFPGRYNYVYPFRFLRWEDDSHFLAEVTGGFSEKMKDENGNLVFWDFECNCPHDIDGRHPKWQQYDYYQIWRFDAKTARRELVSTESESFREGLDFYKEKRAKAMLGTPAPTEQEMEQASQ